MADYSLLAQALQDEDQRARASNPWATAGQIMTSTKLGQARNPWEGIATALAQGLLGGGMTGFGMGQIQNEKADFSRRWANASTQADPVAAFSQDERLAPYAQEMQLSQQMRQEDLQDSTYKTIADALAKDAAATGDPSKLAALKNGKIDWNVLQQAQQPQQPGLGFTGDPIANKVSQYAQMLKRENPRAPLGSIMETARMMARPDMSAQDRYLKEVEAERESAANLLSLGGTVDSAMKTLGDSTGFGAGIGYQARRMTGMSPEKVQAYESIAGVFPEVVKSKRWPGAMSNMEINSLKTSGPSTANAPETNQFYADLYKGLGNISMQYADYLEQAINQGMTPAQARAAWAKAKADVPLLTNDPTTGAMTINPQASTIFQRLTGGAATADPGAAGSVGAQATQDIPAGMKLQRNPKTGETRIVPQ